MGDVDTYDVFFSYNWRNNAEVEAVAQALRRQGLTVFLDRWYLVPGRPWPQALEEVLASCAAVAVFVGPYGMGPWQQREKFLAISRQDNQPDFPVIPVLLPNADPALGFLSQNTWVDLRQRLDDPTSLAILEAAVRGEPPGPDLKRRVQATLAAVCPYRGLSFFREEDAAFFFGRDVYIKLLDDTVACLPVVAVVGASGCGKSSVVRSGLIPHLRLAPAGQVWDAVTLLPGDRPLQSLAAALLPLLEPEMTEVDRLAEVNKLAQHLAQRNLSLRDVVSRLLEKQTGTHRLLLVVDQAEELYTLTREEETRRRFLDEILEAANTGPLTALFTLRGDFFGQALSYRVLADQLQNAVVNLGPMTREELRQAVEAPARKVQLEFEAGLVTRILDDVGDEPGNLPLLEFALTSLWEARQGSRLLHASYEAMGCVQGAMAQRAEKEFTRLSPLEQQVAPQIFKEMIRTGEGTEDTRRRATLSEVGDAAWPLVRQLADARLLVTGRDETTGTETVEVAHEALIRHWERLRDWLNADREFLLWRQRLRGLLQEWQRTGQDPGVLLRGALLAEAQRWQSRRAGDLSQPERGFIEASIALKDREEAEKRQKQRRELEQAQALAAEQEKRAAAEQQRAEEQEKRAETERQRAEEQSRGRRRLGFLAGALLLAFILSVGIAAYAFILRNRAEEQTALALSRQLSSQAENFKDTQLDLALLLSVEAYKVKPTLQARRALLETIQRSNYLVRYLHHHGDRVRSVAFSPDGELLATGAQNNVIILWEVETGHPRGDPFVGHQGQVTSVAFSSNGKVLASGSVDKTIRLWEVATRRPVAELPAGHASRSLAFSPDGKTLVSESEDDTITWWDLDARQPIGSPWQGSSAVFSPDGRYLASFAEGFLDVIFLLDLATRRFLEPLPSQGQRLAFSPSGQTLAVGSGRGIEILDMGTRQLREKTRKGSQGEVHSLAFSPDGDTLVSGHDDDTIHVWDVRNMDSLGYVQAPKSSVKSLAVGRDGQTLASISGGSAILQWDFRKMHLKSPLSENDYVASIAFSPDGQTLASGGESIILWDVKTRQARRVPLPGSSGKSEYVKSLAFSPDGHTLASGSTAKTITLWDVVTARPREDPLTGHHNEVLSLAFSPDGQTMASGEGTYYGSRKSDGRIMLWDVQKGDALGTLDAHQGSVSSLAFSPDGRTLASGSADQTVILWDVKNRQPRGEPLKMHHAAVNSLAFSPDGKILASGSDDQTIVLWDLASGRPRGAPLTGNIQAVKNVTFSPDGQTLASTDAGTITLWDVATGQLLGQIPSGSICLAFNPPDGQTLASGGFNALILWNMDVTSWLQKAGAIANRNLTRDEWQRLMPDRPYPSAQPGSGEEGPSPSGN